MTTTTPYMSSIESIIDIQKYPFWKVWTGWNVGNRNSFQRNYNEDEDLETSKAELHRYLSSVGANGGKFVIGFSKVADGTTQQRYNLWLKQDQSNQNAIAGMNGMPSMYASLGLSGIDPAIGAPGNPAMQSMIDRIREDERRKVETEHKLDALQYAVDNPERDDWMSKIERLPEPIQMGAIQLLNNLTAKLMGPAMMSSPINGVGQAQVPADVEQIDVEMARLQNQMEAMAQMKEDLINAPTDDGIVGELADDESINASLESLSLHFEDIIDFMNLLAKFVDANPEQAKMLYTQWKQQ